MEFNAADVIKGQIATSDPSISISDLTGKVAVKMEHGSSYSKGQYVFTKKNPIVLMDAAAAEDFTTRNPGQFRILSREEVLKYYKLDDKL